MSKKYITDAPNAPKAIGPYSQAVISNGTVYLSGQVPIDPHTGQVVEGGIEVQTEQVLKNLRAVLACCDCNFDSVVMTTIFLTDLGDFQTVNKLYEAALGASKPARATVQVAALPKGVSVEISMIASLG